MTYTEELCNTLTTRLRSFSTLSPSQVASHVATIEFWADEVIQLDHCRHF